MLEHLAKCRAVCFPPYDEDYGFVTVEAFASRKPVVTCTDSGGPAELVVDDVNGKVCAPRPETLAVALRELMDDRGRCRAAGAGGSRSGIRDDMVSRRQPVADDMTTKPGIIASALVGILLLAFARVGRLSEGERRSLQGRRVDLLHARPQPGARLRFPVRAQGSHSRLGGIFRARGRVPEDGQRRRNPRLELVSLLPLGEARRSRARDAAVFFEVVHLPAGCGAVHRALRDERLSRAARDPDRARSAGDLPVHASRRRSRTGSRCRWRSRSWRHRWCRCTSSGSCRSSSISRSCCMPCFSGPTRKSPASHQHSRTCSSRHPRRACVRLHRGAAHRAGDVLEAAAPARAGADGSARGEPPAVETRRWACSSSAEPSRRRCSR